MVWQINQEAIAIEKIVTVQEYKRHVMSIWGSIWVNRETENGEESMGLYCGLHGKKWTG